MGLDDSSIEVIAEELIDLDVVDATGYDFVEDVSIFKSVLEQHNLLHNDNTSNGDFGEILPLMTVQQSTTSKELVVL